MRLSALCVHARLPLPATVLAGLVACRCLMDLKIRVLGARRGGTVTGITGVNATGQGPGSKKLGINLSDCGDFAIQLPSRGRFPHRDPGSDALGIVL